MRKSTARSLDTTQERRTGCAEVAVCSVNASEKESCCNPSPASARTRRCRLSLVAVSASAVHRKPAVVCCALEPTAPINARVEHALWSSSCRRSRAHGEPRRGLLHRTVKHRVRRRAVDLRFFSGGNSSLSTRRAVEVSPLHRAAPLLLSGPVKRLSAPGPSRWVFRIEHTTHTGRSSVVITV